MSEPIVFISTHRIKEGKPDEFRERYREGASAIQSQKPDTVAFLAYLNEDETEVTTIHVFPDTEAMERHVEGAVDRATGAAEFLEFREFEIYGSPGDQVLESMRRVAGPGDTLDVLPEFVSGYLRLGSTRTPA